MTSETTSPAAGNAAPELSPAQRKALRALAHHLDPVVAIGDGGLSPSVLAETDRALAAHGLIKIRVHGDDRERRARILAEICARLGCAPVQMIGKLLVVWREKRETGTGGDAGTARRRPTRQTKKAAGAGQKASGGRGASARKAAPPARAPSRARPATAGASPGRKPASKSAAKSPAKAGAKPFPKPAAKSPARSPARPSSAAKKSGTATGPRSGGDRSAGAPARSSAGRPVTRSARPGSGTRGRRRAP